MFYLWVKLQAVEVFFLMFHRLDGAIFAFPELYKIPRELGYLVVVGFPDN